MTTKSVEKYLANYAEPEALGALTIKSYSHYKYVLTLPVYAESKHCIDSLLKNLESYCAESSHTKLVKKFLIICVLNQPDNLSPEEDTLASQKNKQLVQQLLMNYTISNTTNNFTLLSSHVNDTPSSNPVSRSSQEYLIEERYLNHDILIIDRFSHGKKIPFTKGVGLARKIASDIASALINDRIIEEPWIFSCDADTKLPNNYFDCLDSLKHENTAAIIFNFKHKLESIEDMQKDGLTEGLNQKTIIRIQEATNIYEACIKYYAKCLAESESRYAYCSLGSCMAFSFKHYCMVRGFPKKPAGEDFYLLNKLAKTGEFISREDISVTIQTRISSRVPFGTGPAVEKIADQLQRNEAPTYYNPKVFRSLKIFIKCFTPSLLKHTGETIDSSDQLSNILNSSEDKPSAQAIYSAAQAIDIKNFFEHKRKQNISPERTFQAFEDWFDAFKTLKFIHYLTKHHFPKLPIKLLNIT